MVLLGDFLKELELTEGRATGIPTILQVLNDNGSPVPQFRTDDSRTYFEVEFFIHPAFKTVQDTIIFDLESQIWNIEGVNELLNLLLEKAGIDIAGGIAGGIAYSNQYTDNQLFKLIEIIKHNDTGGIAGGIADKVIEVLQIAQEGSSRKDIMQGLNIANNANNFENYLQPLMHVGWITMTIPSKPTSPKQKYITTLKGRLIVEILKYKAR